jgi:hypothetical protein
MGKPVYDPVLAGNALTVAPWSVPANRKQTVLFEKAAKKTRYKAG